MFLVEQKLNEHAINPASDHPEDLEELTQNHFLGRANVCSPFAPYAEVHFNHRKMFRLAKLVQTSFGSNRLKILSSEKCESAMEEVRTLSSN